MPYQTCRWSSSNASSWSGLEVSLLMTFLTDRVYLSGILFNPDCSPTFLIFQCKVGTQHLGANSALIANLLVSPISWYIHHQALQHMTVQARTYCVMLLQSSWLSGKHIYATSHVIRHSNSHLLAVNSCHSGSTLRITNLV